MTEQNTVYAFDYLHAELFGRFDIEKPDETKKPAFDNRNWRGEPLPREGFPKRMFGRKTEPTDEDDYIEEVRRTYANLPHIVYGYSPVISKQLKDIFTRFDLGQANFYPIELVDYDHKTPLPGGPWFSVNFGNAKTGYLPEKSPKTNKMRGSERYFAHPHTQDNDIVLNADVLMGPEIWVDPLMREVIFFSAPLGNALIAAGHGPLLNLKQCKLIETGPEKENG